MPFCPKCRYEYREGFETCPDCDETLVPELPEIVEDVSPQKVAEDDDEEWVQLARFTSNQLAEMVVEGLKSKGIPAVLFSADGYYGVIGHVGGGSSVMVPLEHVAKADRVAELILGDLWDNAKLVDVEEEEQ
jgi:hypothetical protein